MLTHIWLKNYTVSEFSGIFCFSVIKHDVISSPFDGSSAESLNMNVNNNNNNTTTYKAP